MGAALLAAVVAHPSWAQTVYSEDFTGAATTNSWYFINGACLTAGSGTSTASPGNIPSCGTVWTSYYSKKTAGQTTGGYAADIALVGGSQNISQTTGQLDTVGSGALRLTNGSTCNNGNCINGYQERGSIVSRDAFVASQGVHITFKAVVYHGTGGIEGADGMSFFLIDGSLAPGSATYNGIGAPGGSLGYSCANANQEPDGLAGAYLGLGMDEYGNFLNQSDNTSAGSGFVGNRISLRGAGNVSWAALNTTYPFYYPSSLLATAPTGQASQRALAVQQTCAKGAILDYSGGYTSNPQPVSTNNLASKGYTQVRDYAPITNGSITLATGPSGNLANVSALTRPTGLTVAGVTSGNVFFYDLAITQTGILNLSYSVNGGAYASILKNSNITVAGGNPALPATLRFGFAASTGGYTNIHEILCFKAAPNTTSSTSSATNQQQTGKVQTGTQAYFAYYNPNDWTGTVTAYGLDDSSGTLLINSTANWDAQCFLTGISNFLPVTNPVTTTCASTGLTTPTAAQSPTTGSGGRVMLTWSGTQGIAFEWANLTTAEQNVIDAGDTTKNGDRVNYLRGVRTNEKTNTVNGTLFNLRDALLGDIVDSSPVWVGPPNSPYKSAFTDRYVPADAAVETAGSYASFVTTNQSRLNLIYVGANDGFLHAFRSGSQDVSGTLVANSTTPNDGGEALAYMPGTVLNTIHNATTPALDFANVGYAHNFFVDATPGTGDLYYGGAWHTWLVGGLGMGGAGIYALDITNANNFTESNPTGVVVGDWSSATISCNGNSTCGKNIGNTFGTPLIRRFHNGMWGAIFGNGFASSSGDAGIFVMTVDQTSGAKTFYYLSTATGSSSNPNGIAYVTSADLDGDHITDYVYAGDLLGNVWRFDLTAATASGWVSAASGIKPLFKTQTGQPITTQLVVAAAQVVGAIPAVLISFGTGQRTQLTNTSGITYSTATQSIYGVWDWNFTTWNASSPTDYASLTGAQVAQATKLAAPYTLTSAQLQAQTFTLNAAAGTVDSSNTAVNWATCATTCTGMFGWYVNLQGDATASIEQIVSSPALFQQAVIVNSTIPGSNAPLSCASGTDTGITYVISLLSGGTTFTTGGTPAKTSAFLNNIDVNTVGLTNNETGALSVVTTASAGTYLIGQLISPVVGTTPGVATKIKLPINVQANRLTWTQLR